MRWSWAVLAVCGLAFAGDGDEDGRLNPPRPIERPFTQRDMEEMQRGLWRVRIRRNPMQMPLAPRPLRPLGPRGMPLPQGGPGQVPAEAAAPDANQPEADGPQEVAPPGADPGVQPPKGGGQPPVVKRPPPLPLPK